MKTVVDAIEGRMAGEHEAVILAAGPATGFGSLTTNKHKWAARLSSNAGSSISCLPGSHRAAWNFSVAMTTRGGPGIVLASLAYSVGIISQHSGF